MVTATMIQQLPGTKLPSPRILRAPADSSTNTADQSAIILPGSPGTPTEEDARGGSGLAAIQSAYLDPNSDTQKATYTYGNVLTEGGASYPSHPPMPGSHGDGGEWTGAPPHEDKRHAQFDNNNQSQPNLPAGATPPGWNQPPFGGPQGPPSQGPPQQPWENPQFQPMPDPNTKQPFNPEGPFHGHHRRDHKRDGNRPPGGERFPPDERPDRPPHRRHSKEEKHRGWEHERERERDAPLPPSQAPPQWDPQQLEEGELPPHEDRGHHRSGPPPDHEQWRPRGHGPRRGGHRGSHDSGHRGGGYGGQRRDDHRGHNRGHGHRGQGPGDDRRGWGGNMHDRGGRGKWRGQGGGRGRDHGGGSKFDYHRY